MGITDLGGITGVVWHEHHRKEVIYLALFHSKLLFPDVLIFQTYQILPLLLACSFEHKDSQGLSLPKFGNPSLEIEAACQGHYLTALSIQKQDLRYDVLIKPGEELTLGSMEGHGPIDHHDIRLAQAPFPTEKTLKTRRNMKNLTEGVSFLSCLFLILGAKKWAWDD